MKDYIQPKNLTQAIINGIINLNLFPLDESIYHALKDFISNRFQAAILKHEGNKEIQEALMDLHDEITRRE